MRVRFQTCVQIQASWFCTGQDFPHLFLDSIFLKYTRLMPDRIDERKVLGSVKPLSYLADMVFFAYVFLSVR